MPIKPLSESEQALFDARIDELRTTGAATIPTDLANRFAGVNMTAPQPTNQVIHRAATLPTMLHRIR